MPTVFEYMLLQRALRAWRQEVTYNNVFFTRVVRLARQHRATGVATEEEEDEFHRQFWALWFQYRVALNVSEENVTAESRIERL